MKYKDIVNFSIINKIKQYMNDACIVYNNLIKKDKVKNRESEYYEIYTKQYTDDLNSLITLRNNCQNVVDLCNKTILNINKYHIKQYYIDKEELSEYEFKDEYENQSNNIDDNDDDMW